MTVGRLRHRIPRSRVPRRLRLLMDPAALRYWAGVLVLAGLLATIVGRSLAAADDARRSWGRTVAVVVAAHDVAAGDPLDAGAVRRARWPAALVPDGALAEVPSLDLRARAPIAEGTLLTTASARADERDDGRRTVSIPVDDAALPVRPGDRVDVWAIADPTLVADGAQRARLVAEDAEVVDRRTGAVTVAVHPLEVEPTAAAATVEVVLVGSP